MGQLIRPRKKMSRTALLALKECYNVGTVLTSTLSYNTHSLTHLLSRLVIQSLSHSLTYSVTHAHS
jgi:hypothetical protein